MSPGRDPRFGEGWWVGVIVIGALAFWIGVGIALGADRPNRAVPAVGEWRASCEADPDAIFCRRPPAPAVAPWSSARQEELRRAQRTALWTLARRPRAREGDRWGVGDDCEEHAIIAHEHLRAAGWPEGAVEYVIGWHRGRGHAWLEVVTEDGRWALDVNHERPVRPEALIYKVRSVCPAVTECRRWR